LWLPDLNILNIADGTAGFVPISSTNLAIVNNTGLVYVIFSMSGLKTKCSLTAFYYPYDRQNCSILVGSWQHDTSRINFLSSDNFVDLTSYTAHPVWNLKRVDVEKMLTNTRFLNTFSYQSGDIGFYLIMQRGAMYSIINNIFPSVILIVVMLAAYYVPLIAAQIGLSIFLIINNNCFI